MSMPSSPYDLSILRTEFVPDMAQSATIQTSIALYEKHRSDLDSRLLELVKQIEDLGSQRAVLDTTLAIHKALDAPVRRLMPEILGEIFEYCVDGPSFRSSRAPVLLTHICHRWRQLAHGCPRLWTQLAIDDNCEHIDASLPIALWLKNSGSLPLDITVDPRSSGDGWEKAKVIMEHLPRCGRFTITCSWTTLNEVLPVTVRTRLTLLQSLSVVLITIPDDRSEMTFPDVIWDFPHMHTLVTWHAGFLLQLIMPTNNLRKLHVRSRGQDFIPYGTWSALMRTCSNVEDVEIDLACVESITDAGPSGPLTWLNLRRLRLSLGSRCSMDEMSFLINLHAPHIKYLKVNGNRWYEGDAVYQTLYNLVNGSRSSLRRLSLVDVDLPSDQALALLNIATEIEEIKLNSSVFLAALLPARGIASNHWTCPKLTTLKVHDDCVSRVDFVTLIKRRAMPAGRNGLPNSSNDGRYLTKVKIKDGKPHRWSRKVRRSLRELRHHSREDLIIEGLGSLHDEDDESD